MSRLLWLASYPKSGNTWLRVFIANLKGGGPAPAQINALGIDCMAAGRRLFEDETGVAAADLTPEEVERLRPRVYESLAQRSRSVQFVKIHDAYTTTPAGEALVPQTVTNGAVYVIRNPLDVACSMASHMGYGIDRAIAVMADPEYALNQGTRRLHIQLRQRLLSWSGHVLSWVDAPGLRLHVVRFEDMKGAPLATFQGVARFCGLAHDPEQVQRALGHSSFPEMQRQEREGGFAERPSTAAAFFRKGEVGTWRAELTDRQVGRVLADHGEVMSRFGYL